MLKNILKLDGVKELSIKKMKSTNGGRATLTHEYDCVKHYDVCNEKHPNNHDKFSACMEYKGCHV